MNTVPHQTFEDAAALTEKEHDSFYVYDFVIRAWIGELFLQAIATYADNKDARDRPMQTGQAWRRLSFVFRNAPEKHFLAFFDSLISYSQYPDDEVAALLHHAV